MIALDSLYPEYGFASNKGYGSAPYRGTSKYGPCPIHRRTLSKISQERMNKRHIGTRMEEIAAAWLEKQGNRILEHSYRGAGAEIDLIYEEGQTLVFAEVKYRSLGALWQTGRGGGR